MLISAQVGGVLGQNAVENNALDRLDGFTPGERSLRARADKIYQYTVKRFFLLHGFPVFSNGIPSQTYPLKGTPMKLLSTILVLLVAAEHFYIAWLEMTQIPSEKAAETFKLPYEFMEQKRVQTLFGNQGLYNGFLAVGLLWAQFAAPDNAVYGATVLFLGFVLIAAAWGAFSSGNKGILVKQGLPAMLAAVAVLAV